MCTVWKRGRVLRILAVIVKGCFFRVVYLSTGNVRGNEFDSSSLFFFGNSGIFFEFDIVASK